MSERKNLENEQTAETPPDEEPTAANPADATEDADGEVSGYLLAGAEEEEVQTIFRRG